MTPTARFASFDAEQDRTGQLTQHDTLGRRRRRRPQSTGKRVSLQDRDLIWLQKLHEHGPLPSSFLLAFAKNTHRSAKRTKERLTDLFNEDNTAHGGPYLSRPPQQFRTLDSRYKQLVYDLTPAAEKALKQAGLWNSRTAKRPGPWLHGFMVSSITASIELATRDRRDLTFIPKSRLLERAGKDLRCPVDIPDPETGRLYKKDLIPDALFALEYDTPAGKRYRSFLVEADRSTEPATSANFNRKSWRRSLAQYERYVGQDLYQNHLRLKSSILILNVVTDPKRIVQIGRIIETHAPSLAPRMLFQAWEDFGPVFTPPKPRTALLEGGWSRVNLPEVRIDRAKN
ncbi:MAG: replication-relaxation family protein [Maritimibacter sp.]|nr:replication-relaxation family protein [Maritimibacter sp.]